MERRTGVRAVHGGSHPGRGTRNALMSLGPSLYVEILAPDPAQNVHDPDVDSLRGMASLAPIGWAVHTRDAEALRERLQSNGLEVSPSEAGSRARPDGVLLEWATFAVTKPDHVLAPFFIRWADMSRHPALGAPGGCTFASLHLQDADPAPLEAILAPLHLPVRVAKANIPAISLAMSCPRGAVTFR